MNSSSKFLYNPSLNNLIDTLVFFIYKGALILCSWIIYGALKAELKTLIDSEEAEDKAKMIYIQQMDITYDSVNFDDPLSTLSYFAKLCQPFTPHSEEEFNQQFKILMMQIIKMGAKDDSIISAEFQALHIMRSTAEKIHSVFRELNRDADASTAELVTLVVTEALASLIYLARDDDPSPNWVILSG